jgi:hypothetical protein
MTIGIGVLASEGGNPTPNRLALIADTKGSFGAAYSMKGLHKVFVDPIRHIYAVGADQIDRAAELFEVIKDVSGVIKGGTTRYGSIVESIGGASDLYKRVRFKLDVLPTFARMTQSLPDMFTDEDLSPELLKAWRNYYCGCEMLVGAFNQEGQAFLLHSDGTGKVENLTYPGFAAIGSGADNAMFWLSHRSHNHTLPIRRAAYHAFEAKFMAESSPFVNEEIEMIIASRGKWFPISDNSLEVSGAPITLKEMREMFSAYGPKGTEDLK